MANYELIKYVRHMRDKGVSDKEIQKALLDEGYTESDIYGALWFDPNKAEEEHNKKKPKRRGTSGTLLSMIIILALLWFAALLYVRVWDPPWNPLPEPPTEFTKELPFI